MDYEKDPKLNEYKVLFDRMLEELTKFGLTPNQSKIYMYLGKYGAQTALLVSKFLKLPRTETYQLVNNLQKKGIVSVIFGHPLRYVALPFGNAMEMLIDTQRERVKELEKGQKKLEKIWNQIPDFLVDQDLTRETKLQILQGQTQIFSQINKMYANTKKEFLIFGSEKDFLRFYHADFFELIKNSKHDVKILTSCSKDTMYVFKGFPRTRIKRVQDSATQNLCFIIKDDAQLIFFVRNNPQKSQDLQAVLTDSRSLITSMKQLFNLNWSYMKISTNYEKASLIRKSQSDYDFKLKELEQKRLLMKGIKKYVIKMILKNKKSKKRRKMKRSEY